MQATPTSRSTASGRGRLAAEQGYAMAALLVGLSVMAVVMSAALPVWSTQAKRMREDELVFRGEQYARAISLYQRKYANAFPPSIDVLVNERFLRRKYLDPVTGKDFQPLAGAVTAGGPGGVAGGGTARSGGVPGGVGTSATAGRGAATAGAGARGGATPNPVAGPGAAPLGGGGAIAGGISGVASRSTEKSLRLYNGRGKYNEWAFVAVQRSLEAGGGADGPRAGAPGAGGRGASGAGAGPGRAGGARGTGSFRPPAGSGRGFRPGADPDDDD